MRSRTNHVSGWLLGFGLWAGAVALDPLHLYSTWSDVPAEEPWYVQTPYYAFFMVLAIGAFAVFARPRVELLQDTLILRNPLRDVRIPLACITKADTNGKHTVIHADGAKHTAWGTESLNIQHGGGISAAVAARGSKASAGTSGGGTVAVAPRRPEAAEVLLLALWLAYPLAAALADLLG
jgi:hypothetical protein